MKQIFPNLRFSIISLFLISCILTSRPVLSQGITTTTVEQEIRKEISGKNGSFHIRIKIVDEKGKPVQGVTVSTSAGTFKWLTISDTRSSKEVNGEYVQDFSNCGVITLYVYSPKYHEVPPISYVFDKPKSGVRIVGSKHYYDNETVVMKNIAGPVAKLEERKVFFDWKPKEVKILDLRTLVSTQKPIGYYKDITPSSSTIPGMYLELVPTTTTIDPVMDGWKPSNRRTPKDAYLELVVDDGTTTGGLCLVSFAGKNAQDVAISMQAVPNEKYQKRIRITPDMLQRTHDGMNPVFFYFQILGFYGKGEIDYCEYLYRPAERSYPEQESARVCVNFKVQTDGSRNVLTRE
jgi:hypothetical protein